MDTLEALALAVQAATGVGLVSLDTFWRSSTSGQEVSATRSPFICTPPLPLPPSTLATCTAVLNSRAVADGRWLIVVRGVDTLGRTIEATRAVTVANTTAMPAPPALGIR